MVIIEMLMWRYVLFNIKMSNTLVNFPQEPVKKPESRKWSWAGDSTKTVEKNRETWVNSVLGWDGRKKKKNKTIEIYIILQYFEALNYINCRNLVKTTLHP